MVAALTSTLRRLHIDVSPSEISNDHQARILIDGEDLLGAEALGLDPPDLAAQLTTGGARLRIGRCACGAVGCGDVHAVAERRTGIVIWHLHGQTAAFDERQYDEEVDRFRADRDWAPIERLAEFAADALLAGSKLDGGLSFDWSSARIKRQVMTFSFSNEHEQRLIEETWDGRTIGSASEAAAKVLREHHDR